MSVVLKEFLDIFPLKIPNSLSPMLDIQHVIYFERHVELPDSLPSTRDEENEDNLNLRGCVQIISSKAWNSLCSISKSQSYSVHNYKFRKSVDLLPMFAHIKMSYPIKSFVCRVYNLRIEIIKQIQESNEQYNFQVDLHKYHDTLNVKYYFIIQIRPELYHLKTNHKFQVNNARPFKVSQMIE